MTRIGATVLTCLLSAPLAAGRPVMAEGAERPADVRAVPFSALEGWAGDDLGAALEPFRRSCAAAATGRSRVSPPAELASVCRAVPADPTEARSFLESRFKAYEVPAQGFLTGYYEPEFAGAMERSEAFPVPLLARPADLVPVPVEARPAGFPAELSAARRTGDGLQPYPDRAAIEDGALRDEARPVVFLKDAVDAFVVHVQGSAAIRLPDGQMLRVAYDGRNGHPYTSVARLLRARLAVPAEDLTADKLAAWLRAHPEEARELLRANRSYIFFRIAAELRPDEGPLGAAGVPLTAGRSLAIDSSLWPYGVPAWIEAEVARPEGGTERLRRLAIVQDTGSAITGPARADLFVGTGPEAGARAGVVRAPLRVVILWPEADAAPPPSSP